MQNKGVKAEKEKTCYATPQSKGKTNRSKGQKGESSDEDDEERSDENASKSSDKGKGKTKGTKGKKGESFFENGSESFETEKGRTKGSKGQEDESSGEVDEEGSIKSANESFDKGTKKAKGFNGKKGEWFPEDDEESSDENASESSYKGKGKTKGFKGQKGEWFPEDDKESSDEEVNESVYKGKGKTKGFKGQKGESSNEDDEESSNKNASESSYKGKGKTKGFKGKKGESFEENNGESSDEDVSESSHKGKGKTNGFKGGKGESSNEDDEESSDEEVNESFHKGKGKTKGFKGQKGESSNEDDEESSDENASESSYKGKGKTKGFKGKKGESSEENNGESSDEDVSESSYKGKGKTKGFKGQKGEWFPEDDEESSDEEVNESFYKGKGKMKGFKGQKGESFIEDDEESSDENASESSYKGKGKTKGFKGKKGESSEENDGESFNEDVSESSYKGKGKTKGFKGEKGASSYGDDSESFDTEKGRTKRFIEQKGESSNEDDEESSDADVSESSYKGKGKTIGFKGKKGESSEENNGESSNEDVSESPYKGKGKTKGFKGEKGASSHEDDSESFDTEKRRTKGFKGQEGESSGEDDEESSDENGSESSDQGKAKTKGSKRKKLESPDEHARESSDEDNEKRFDEDTRESSDEGKRKMMGFTENKRQRSDWNTSEDSDRGKGKTKGSKGQRLKDFDEEDSESLDKSKGEGKGFGGRHGGDSNNQEQNVLGKGLLIDTNDFRITENDIGLAKDTRAWTKGDIENKANGTISRSSGTSELSSTSSGAKGEDLSYSDEYKHETHATTNAITDESASMHGGGRQKQKGTWQDAHNLLLGANNSENGRMVGAKSSNVVDSDKQRSTPTRVGLEKFESRSGGDGDVLALPPVSDIGEHSRAKITKHEMALDNDEVSWQSDVAETEFAHAVVLRSTQGKQPVCLHTNVEGVVSRGLGPFTFSTHHVARGDAIRDVNGAAFCPPGSHLVGVVVTPAPLTLEVIILNTDHWGISLRNGRVVRIEPGGAIDAWNKTSGLPPMCEGDVVECINGVKFPSVFEETLSACWVAEIKFSTKESYLLTAEMNLKRRGPTWGFTISDTGHVQAVGITALQNVDVEGDCVLQNGDLVLSINRTSTITRMRGELQSGDSVTINTRPRSPKFCKVPDGVRVIKTCRPKREEWGFSLENGIASIETECPLVFHGQRVAQINGARQFADLNHVLQTAHKIEMWIIPDAPRLWACHACSTENHAELLRCKKCNRLGQYYRVTLQKQENEEWGIMVNSHGAISKIPAASTASRHNESEGEKSDLRINAGDQVITLNSSTRVQQMLQQHNVTQLHCLIKRVVAVPSFTIDFKREDGLQTRDTLFGYSLSHADGKVIVAGDRQHAPSSKLQQWNRLQENIQSGLDIRQGDRIVSVNGHTESTAIMEALQHAAHIKMQVHRTNVLQKNALSYGFRRNDGSMWLKLFRDADEPWGVIVNDAGLVTRICADSVVGRWMEEHTTRPRAQRNDGSHDNVVDVVLHSHGPIGVKLKNAVVPATVCKFTSEDTAPQYIKSGVGIGDTLVALNGIPVDDITPFDITRQFAAELRERPVKLTFRMAADTKALTQIRFRPMLDVIGSINGVTDTALFDTELGRSGGSIELTFRRSYRFLWRKAAHRIVHCNKICRERVLPSAHVDNEESVPDPPERYNRAYLSSRGRIVLTLYADSRASRLGLELVEHRARDNIIVVEKVRPSGLIGQCWNDTAPLSHKILEGDEIVSINNKTTLASMKKMLQTGRNARSARAKYGGKTMPGGRSGLMVYEVVFVPFGRFVPQEERDLFLQDGHDVAAQRCSPGMQHRDVGKSDVQSISETCSTETDEDAEILWGAREGRRESLKMSLQQTYVLSVRSGARGDLSGKYFKEDSEQKRGKQSTQDNTVHTHRYFRPGAIPLLLEMNSACKSWQIRSISRKQPYARATTTGSVKYGADHLPHADKWSVLLLNDPTHFVDDPTFTVVPEIQGENVAAAYLDFEQDAPSKRRFRDEEAPPRTTTDLTAIELRKELSECHSRLPPEKRKPSFLEQQESSEALPSLKKLASPMSYGGFRATNMQQKIELFRQGFGVTRGKDDTTSHVSMDRAKARPPGAQQYGFVVGHDLNRGRDRRLPPSSFVKPIHRRDEKTNGIRLDLMAFDDTNTEEPHSAPSILDDSNSDSDALPDFLDDARRRRGNAAWSRWRTYEKFIDPHRDPVVRFADDAIDMDRGANDGARHNLCGIDPQWRAERKVASPLGDIARPQDRMVPHASIPRAQACARYAQRCDPGVFSSDNAPLQSHDGCIEKSRSHVENRLRHPASPSGRPTQKSLNDSSALEHVLDIGTWPEYGAGPLAETAVMGKHGGLVGTAAIGAESWERDHPNNALRASIRRTKQDAAWPHTEVDLRHPMRPQEKLVPKGIVFGNVAFGSAK